MQNAECRMPLQASRFTFHVSRPSCRAFTMIEIAISLAVIGFALVAILGVLPLGMNVQKENREETIINQDATVFMNAIRSGARGMDDLTNYVMAIRIDATQYVNNTPSNLVPVSSWYSNSSVAPQYLLDSGSRIVGLLSTPKYLITSDSDFVSNSVVAYVRSLSGAASDKFPQTNAALQDLAFSYRMISEVVPYWTNYYNPSWFNTNGLSAAEVVARSNLWVVTRNLQTNLHDLRLTFRWPLAKGTNALGRQVFRTLAGGVLTNDPPGQPLFFFQPQTYVKAP